MIPIANAIIARASDFLEGVVQRTPNVHKARHVAVLEYAHDLGWKLVEANVDADHIEVTRATTLTLEEAGARTEPIPNTHNLALVMNSHRSVCRLFPIVRAPDAQIKKMLALRLETELPYPVEDATWSYAVSEDDTTEEPTVLIVATAKQEIEKVQTLLDTVGLKPGTIDFGAANLAELARCESQQRETVAIANLCANSAVFVVTQGGELRYVRQINIAPRLIDDIEQWTQHVVNEYEQSVCDYLLRFEDGAPSRMLVVGDVVADTERLSILEEQLEIPVEPLACTGAPQLRTEGVLVDELLAEYPACLGALFAECRRIRGENTAAPALVESGAARRSSTFAPVRNRLVGASLVALVLVLAGTIALPHLQLASANRILEESKPILRQLQMIEAEAELLKYETLRYRSMLDTFAALADVFPKGVQIESLNIDPKGAVTITGKTKSIEAISGTTITAMEESPMFINPKSMGVTQDKDGFGFRITLTLRGGRSGGGTRP